MLSAKTILASANPYLVVTDYINEFHIEFGDEGVEQLREGLQMALLLLDLDSEYHNGGLLQYLGNRTDDCTVEQSTVRVQTALRRMGASELADVVREAHEYWESLLRKYPSEDDCGTLIDEARPVFKRFDDRFEKLYEPTTSILNEYIRRHVDEFCDDESLREKSLQ